MPETSRFKLVGDGLMCPNFLASMNQQAAENLALPYDRSRWPYHPKINLLNRSKEILFYLKLYQHEKASSKCRPSHSLRLGSPAVSKRPVFQNIIQDNLGDRTTNANNDLKLEIKNIFNKGKNKMNHSKNHTKATLIVNNILMLIIAVLFIIGMATCT